MTTTDLRDQLIVGLDVPTVAEAEKVVEELGDAATFYKIGYQLVFAGGLDFAKSLIAAKKKSLSRHEAPRHRQYHCQGRGKCREDGRFHAYPKAMRSAVEAAKGSDLCLLGVTVLTSMDDADLKEAGYSDTPEALVLKRAQQARDAGMGGIVASAAEAFAIPQAIGPDMAVVTPGIRPAGAEKGDQKRVMTPADALKAGASHLVVARPIVGASDRRASALAILEEMRSVA